MKCVRFKFEIQNAHFISVALCNLKVEVTWKKKDEKGYFWNRRSYQQLDVTASNSFASNEFTLLTTTTIHTKKSSFHGECEKMKREEDEKIKIQETLKA